MNVPADQLSAAVRLAIAALIGLGVGLERQWSGHASGPDARFAGLRTFFMLGAAGGVAGLLLSLGYNGAGATLLGGGVALAIVAYTLAARRPEAEPDATTETAAVVVLALGALAGVGWTMLAAGVGSVVLLALNEKARLHGAVERVGEPELRAAMRFAVLALVVLPLLPSSLTLVGFEIRPRSLWAIVLFFSALNFAAYVARRMVRPDRGYSLTGMLGGFISSTGVTLLFSRRSRAQPELAPALAAGVIGACTVLVPRVLAVSLVLNPQVALPLAAYLAPALLVGAGIMVVTWRSEQPAAIPDEPSHSPLRIGVAIGMALAFQAAMLAIDYVRARWAAPGLYTIAGLLGLTNVDALTVSMNAVADGMTPLQAARAITVGILANTAFKLAMALSLGDRRFRYRAAGGLLLMGTATAAALTFW